MEIHTVRIAISANIIIFFAKLGVWLISGSSSLLAEAVHSFVDVLNQCLLAMGIRGATRAPTVTHPYGYAKDKFIFSLISAVAFFCLGAGVSIWHGVGTMLTAPNHFNPEHVKLGLLVLALSLPMEGYSFFVAIKSLTKGAKANGMTLYNYVLRGYNPTGVAIVMEDGGAVIGLIVAGMCTAMVQYTGKIFWDALGSILVGILLGLVALFLIRTNRSLLIGRAMDPDIMKQVICLLEKDPVVARVLEAKSEEIGPGMYRFKADIHFHGNQIVKNHIQRFNKQNFFQKIKHAVAMEEDKKTDEYLFRTMLRFGENLVNTLGAEVDRIENNIQQKFPGIKYVDLEADRGIYRIETAQRNPVDAIDVSMSQQQQDLEELQTFEEMQYQFKQDKDDFDPPINNGYYSAAQQQSDKK